MNDKEFLSYFEHLASPSTPDKSITSSANSILQTLLALDHNPSATSKPLKPSAFGSHISEDLDYTLIRLIRGMTSQTLKVQFHFALVLKLLLQRFDVILNQNYLDFLLKECNNKAQKSEIPHLIIAKHLGITSLIESRSLSDDTLLSFIFEIVINDIEKYPFIEELGVRVLEIAFYDNYKDKTKRNTSEIKTILKLVANKFKAVNKNDNPNHIRLLLTLSKAYKEFVNTVDFPFKKQLENCLLDYNKLLKLLIKSSEKFPKEPFFISSVVGYIHEYAETQGKKEIWTAFFDYFSKELTDHKEKSSNFDYKKAFLLLDLFKTFLKAEKFEIQMLNLIPDELVTLWLKNLNVQNETLRKISKKIEKILVKLIQKCEKTPENREEILTFVLHMKEGAYYKFSGANPFAKAFFQEVLTGDLIEKYWKFLKKKLSHAQETNYKLYLIGEILHFFEWKLEELQEEKLLEIISMVFKENDEAKIRKTIIKDEDEEIVKQEITKFQEITFDYFYSLLNGVIKRNSEKFSKKKSVIWKGLTKDNRCLLFAILDNCQKHVEMTNKQNKEINNKKFDKLKKNNSLIFQVLFLNNLLRFLI